MHMEYVSDLMGFSHHTDLLREAAHHNLVRRVRPRAPRSAGAHEVPRGRMCFSLAGQQVCLLP